MVFCQTTQCTFCAFSSFFSVLVGIVVLSVYAQPSFSVIADAVAKAREEVLGPRATAQMRWEHPVNPSSVRDDKIIFLSRQDAFAGGGGGGGGSGGRGEGEDAGGGGGGGGDGVGFRHMALGQKYLPRGLQRLMRGILRIRAIASQVVRLQSDRVEFQLVSVD